MMYHPSRYKLEGSKESLGIDGNSETKSQIGSLSKVLNITFTGGTKKKGENKDLSKVLAINRSEGTNIAVLTML